MPEKFGGFGLLFPALRSAVRIAVLMRRSRLSESALSILSIILERGEVVGTVETSGSGRSDAHHRTRSRRVLPDFLIRGYCPETDNPGQIRLPPARSCESACAVSVQTHWYSSSTAKEYPPDVPATGMDKEGVKTVQQV